MAGEANSARKAKKPVSGKASKTASKTKASSQGKEASKPTGRPSSYTDEAGKRICELLASGKPLTPRVTKEYGLPDPTTIYRWTEDNEAFRLEYTRARQYQAHVYADEIIELSDTAEDAGIAKLQIDTRKWYASKIIPKLYGDKQLVDVTTDIGATAAKVLMDLTQQARDAKAIEHNVIDVTPIRGPSLDKGVTAIENIGGSHLLPKDSED